jgi:hypothetical protein
VLANAGRFGYRSPALARANSSRRRCVHQQPVLEGGIADRDAVEEVAVIERRCQ